MKRKYSEIEELRKGLRYIKIAFPYLFSHHPHCKTYEKDVLHAGGRRFCWGCIVTYPVAILTLLLVILLQFQNQYPWYAFIITGFAFGSFEFISLWRKGTGLRHRMIKISLGIGIALFTIGIFLIPIHIIIRLYIFFMCYMLAGLSMTLRLKGIEKKCKRCEWEGNWYQCPGFEELNSKLEKKGLLKRDKARKWEIKRRKSKL